MSTIGERRTTKTGSEVSHYQGLLARAVAGITEKAEEKGVESLFQRAVQS